MLSDGRFWIGFAAGVGAVYGWNRYKAARAK